MHPLRLFDSDQPTSPKKKRSRRLPNFLRDEQANRLLSHCRIEIDAATCPSKVRAAHRDEIIVHLGLFLGLRVSEMIHLDVTHLDLAGGTCFVCQGKGDKDRYIPIPARFIDTFRAWVAGRTSGLLLQTSKGDALSIETIEWRMRRLGKIAGLERKLKPHTLRHSAAVRLLETGADVEVIREFLGHTNLATTAVYLHCTAERLRKAVDKM